MPGGPYSKLEIVLGVRSGLLKEEELRLCCGRVVQAILDSAIQKEYIEK